VRIRSAGRVIDPPTSKRTSLIDHPRARNADDGRPGGRMAVLPSRPDLGRLKRLARALERAASNGAPEALSRLRIHFADLTAADAKLAHAQLVLAREHGSPSWPALVARVKRRVARNAGLESRRRARAEDAEALAQSWFRHANTGDFGGLVASLAVAKRRMLAARALMQADQAAYDAFLDTLVRGTAHPNPRIRFECAHALDGFGDARCVEPLTRLIDDPVPRVRWIAMHALSCHACNDSSCVDDPAVQTRIAKRARTDASIQVRRHATTALGMIGAPAAVQTLRAIVAAERDAALLRAANWAL